MNLISGRLRRELLDQRIARLDDKLQSVWTMAGLVHPERPLSRGFARVTARDGRTLSRVSDARAEKAVTLHFSDGAVDAEVRPAAAPARPVERKARAPYMPPQPGLFDAGEE
jgi:exodeoxyribonuclease VII large subunit